ncbi:MAG: class I SAM-dependent methyltransferase, partial [Pseudoflavonifractor sp.]
DGQVFLDETEDTYCVWRGEFSEKRNICTYGMDIFRLEQGDRWLRGGEVHEEYAYSPDELEGYLRDAGFTHIRQYGALSLQAPKAGAQRIFFTARKPG